MAQSERDTLKVDVPVGFLLSEPREILVSVDRESDTPLAIRLRLIPAEVEGRPEFGANPSRSADDTPAPIRRLARKWPTDALTYHEHGGCD
jgi:hypothetical protein